MPKVKDIGRSAAKWQQNAGNATGDYVDGVQNPKADWAQSTAAANDNWKAGVQKAATNNTFQRGVQKAGTQKQMTNAVNKGSARYAQGVAGATQDYSDATAPYLNVIANTTLPPRKPKGDPSNLQRVGALNTALYNAKQTNLGGRK